MELISNPKRLTLNVIKDPDIKGIPTSIAPNTNSSSGCLILSITNAPMIPETTISQTAAIGNIKKKRIAKWTLPIFLERAKEVHGNKYNYNQIKPEDINNGHKSKVPIICNNCNNQWKPTINDHINSQSGCPECAGNVAWNLIRFLQRTKEIHGDKFDYRLVTAEHVKNAHSHVPVICNNCGYNWVTPITSHINQRTGCPSCSGKARWTMERFLQCAHDVHDYNFDYSQIKPEDLGSNSNIPITCMNCGYSWKPILSDHIRGHGCPKCYGNARWTLERLLEKAKEVHGEIYDYSLVTSEHIKCCNSHIPVICNICGYDWEPPIDAHINRKTGCPNCAGCVKWTLNRFLQKAKETHGNNFDYTLIKTEDIKDKESKIPIIHKACGSQYYQRIHNHINGKNGCRKCKGQSKGERECSEYLSSLNISYMTEFILENLPKKRFDFRFEYGERRFLLEFDGRQHFEYVDLFYSEEEEFINRQEIDIVKTQKGLEAGYCIIRIDHTQLGNIGKHINAALNSTDLSKSLYVSNPEMYAHILAAIK